MGIVVEQNINSMSFGKVKIVQAKKKIKQVKRERKGERSVTMMADSSFIASKSVLSEIKMNG